MNRPLTVAAGVVLALTAGLRAAPPAPPTGSAPRGAPARLLELVNNERRSRGVTPLTWSADLARLAGRHAEDMQRAGRLSHLSAGDHADYPDRLIAADLPALTAAENIARGADADDAHRGLMASAGHRRNILNPALEHIGIGVSRDPARRAIWFCQDFATLIPRLADREADRRLRHALTGAWQAAGGSLREDRQLSDTLRRALDRMVDEDQLNTSFIAVPGPTWVYAYTTPKPTDLPGDVLSRAGLTPGFGATIRFARTPSTPLGLYWVAIALTGKSNPPAR